MGVAVLHPQDSVRNKPPNHYQTIISHFPNIKFSNPNPKSHRSSRNRKKRGDSSPQDVYVSDPARPASSNPQVNNKQLVRGQVKILKRGEQLAETTPDRQPQTESVGPTLTLTEKVEGLYAGYSMLVMSPPPSSVPLPVFITKKFAAVSDATSDLRKMLRLDFP
ncbi:hypothetical protein E2542_SST03536 [Spatholobus suberectus]|nr:hypothetical protein E2542_SST03536 [Spatholobus suberectus]